MKPLYLPTIDHLERCTSTTDILENAAVVRRYIGIFDWRFRMAMRVIDAVTVDEERASRIRLKKIYGDGSVFT